jgi:hypothetical protein
MLTLLSRLPAAQDVQFDLDSHFNRFVPPSPFPRLPSSISHWVGYRAKAQGPDVGNILVAAWAQLGTFLGLVLVAATMKYTPWIHKLDPPVLIASLVSLFFLDVIIVQAKS